MIDPGDAEVVVIGAGVAGCAAAATAAETGRSVLVVEAGPAGPLPASLRSVDLTESSAAGDWWWPGPYRRGRGVGGGSAVNGMIVQRPAPDDPAATGLTAELNWAWAAIAPEVAEPGPLGLRLEAAAIEHDVVAERAWLSVRSGQRRTAADVWLGDSTMITTGTGVEATSDDIDRMRSAGVTVLVAAGALGSPALLGFSAAKVRDHPSVVVGVELPEHLRADSTHHTAASLLLGSGPVQILVMDHTGRPHLNGALVVSAMDGDDARLEAGVELAMALLDGLGLTGHIQSGPAPVAHACCTLTGIPTSVPVVDASTLHSLPMANPMLTVAAHARRQTHQHLVTGTF